MARLAMVVLLAVLGSGVVVALGSGVAVAQGTPPPPPTPTLVPAVNQNRSYEQIYQLQQFAARDAYVSSNTLLINTTPSGAVWVVERRFTYGDMGVIVVLAALLLFDVWQFVFRLLRR